MTNIVRVSGGLGNQMSQCALALALHQEERLVGIHPVSSPRILKELPLRLPLATTQQVASVYSSPVVRVCRTLLGNGAKVNDALIKQSHLLSPIPNKASYIWCDTVAYDFLEPHEEEIARALKLPAQEQPVAREMSGCESVAVCVSRDDKVCNLTYYQWAMASMSQQLAGEKLHFFVIAPSAQAAAIALKVDPTATVVVAKDGSIEAMNLIAHCRHAIISSTLESWWGAWHIANPDKIVITPKSLANGTSFAAISPHYWLHLTI